jgi:hypothetical protein
LLKRDCAIQSDIDQPTSPAMKGNPLLTIPGRKLHLLQQTSWKI